MNIQFVISSHEHLVKFLDRFNSHMIRETMARKLKPNSKEIIIIYEFQLLML